MPQATLDAVIDHGQFNINNIESTYDDSHSIFASLSALDISISAVTAELEKDGVMKFADAWKELLDNVSQVLIS
jgi:transaldolase